MTRSLALSFLARRLRSPPRLLFLLLLVGQDLAELLLSGRAGPAEGALSGLATLLLGAGLIGQERSDGSLALLLTRPVERSSVVLAAWVAAAAGGLGTWSGLTLLRLALAALPSVEVHASLEIWRLHGLTAVTASAGLGAVVVLFGVCFRGIGGVAAHAGLAYLATTLAGLASDSGQQLLKVLSQGALDLLLPVPRFAELLTVGGWTWLGIVGPASNSTLALLAACWLLERAQLSYSQRG